MGPQLIVIIVNIIPVVGGIYALRRRVWGLALAGAICTLILEVITALIFVAAFRDGRDWPPPWRLACLSVVFGLPGILAIIFVSLSKREFK